MNSIELLESGITTNEFIRRVNANFQTIGQENAIKVAERLGSTLKITGNYIQDNSIPGSKIQNLAITNGKIADTTITNEKIVDETINQNKLSEELQSLINSDYKITFSPDAPTTAINPQEGDIWVQYTKIQDTEVQNNG